MRIVTTSERPDLAELTGLWRWDAFFRENGLGLDEVMARERACAHDASLLPSVLVLLERDEAIGMVALCENDLEGRPDLNPWLAGLYVAPAHRNSGHARHLVGALEDHARAHAIEQLSLYTATATGLYVKCGWSPLETIERTGQSFTIMRKRL